MGFALGAKKNTNDFIHKENILKKKLHKQITNTPPKK